MTGPVDGEPVYEMMWDCPRCDTPALLGVTHRYCPACGAPQDASARYFPPEDQKVAVQDHRFVGADRQCPGCDAPNVATAAFCSGCGAGLEGDAEQVGLVSESPTPEPVSSPSPAGMTAGSGGGSGKVKGCAALGCVGVVLLIIAFFVANSFWTNSVVADVTGHSWTRTVQVEKYQTVSDSDWCDDMPSGAKVKSRTRKKRSTKQVADGQDCKTKKVDNGDGSYKEVQDCKTRTKSQDVDDDWCSYDVQKWVDARELKASGKSTKPSPSWPKGSVKTCGSARVGCEREGRKSETYTVKLKADGSSHACDLDQSKWASLKKGSKANAEITVMTSSLKCSSVRPK